MTADHGKSGDNAAESHSHQVELIRLMFGHPQDRHTPADAEVDDSLIAAAASGTLTQSERADLLRKLAIDPALRAELDFVMQCEADLEAVKSAPAGSLSNAGSGRSWTSARRLIAVLATAAVMLIAVTPFLLTLSRAKPDQLAVREFPSLDDLGTSHSRSSVSPQDVSAHLEEMRRAAEKSPHNRVVQLNYGYALLQGESPDPQQAAQIFEHWIKVNPQDSEAWLSLGLAQYRLQDFGAALKSFRKARELGFESPSLDVNINRAADRHQRMQELSDS